MADGIGAKGSDCVLKDQEDDNSKNNRSFAERVKQLPFYTVLRWLALSSRKPIGESGHYFEESYRLSANPSTEFRANECHALTQNKRGQLCLDVSFLSLFGPNGPLPFFLTEYVIKQPNPFVDFANLFHHRLLSAYYRIWAQTQPVVERAQPVADGFRRKLMALGASQQGCGICAALSPSYLAGKGLEGLRHSVAVEFGVPMRVEEYIGRWYAVPKSEHTRLGQCHSVLGRAAWVGQRIFSRAFAVRLHLHDLTLEQYQSLLPGTRGGQRLASLCDQAIAATIDWELELYVNVLQGVHSCLTRCSSLGRTTWLLSTPNMQLLRVCLPKLCYLGTSMK